MNDECHLASSFKSYYDLRAMHEHETCMIQEIPLFRLRPRTLIIYNARACIFKIRSIICLLLKDVHVQVYI